LTAIRLSGQTLTIRAEKVKQGDGDVLIAVFSAPAGFPYASEKAVSLLRAKTVNGSAEASVELTAGRYAIALFQDSNNDGKLNTNFLGIPKEGYGVSNNAFNLFSAPAFGDAAFDHKGNSVLKIHLKY